MSQLYTTSLKINANTSQTLIDCFASYAIYLILMRKNYPDFDSNRSDYTMD